MTDSYNQDAINIAGSPSAQEIESYDFREVPALVPAGTTATMQGLRIPGPRLRVSRLAWVSVIAPGGGESITLRLFRIRPATNPAGFGFILLNTPFVIDAGSFPGAGVELDFSASILPDLCIFEDEYLACSWVHVGAAVMQPLNMNWNLTPLGASELAEPPATTTVYADVFG